MATTWNPADLSGVALSGGNLIATDSGGTFGDGARSTTSQTTGKVAFTVAAAGASFSAQAMAVGLSEAGASFTGAGNSYILLYVTGTGYAVFGNSAIAAGPDTTSPAPNGSTDVISVLLDSSGLLYFQCNGNNLFGANPAAGTGGISLPTAAWFANIGFGSTVVSGATAGTANFSPTGLPTGFSAWDSSSPVNITGTMAVPATETTGDFTFVGTEVPVWSLVGVSEAAINASGNYTLTEPAGCQQNDILVVDFAARSTVIFTNGAWTFPANCSGTAGNTTNNTTASETSYQSGYCIRGASAPSLAFLRTGGSRTLGTIRAYRSSRSGVPTFDTSNGFIQSSASTTITLTGISPSQADELLVTAVPLARGSATTNQCSAMHATDPSGSSGTLSTTTPPTIGQWIERSDRGNTTSPTVALALYDAVKSGSGATGNLIATAANSALNGMTVMAFQHPSSGTAVTTDFGGLLEFTSGVRSDGAVLLEYIASIKADSTYQLEAIAAIRRDGAGAPEFVAGLSANVAGQLEFLGSMRSDNLGPMELAAAFRSDVIALMESSSGLRSDAAAATEIIASLYADLLGPMENQGTLFVTASSALQIEATSAFSASMAMPAEYLAQVRADAAVADEVLAGAATQSGSAVEFTGSLRSGAAAAVETTGALKADALASIEDVAGVARQSGVPVENVLGVSANSSVELENLGAVAVAGNSAVQLEVTAKLSSDQAASVETSSAVRSDVLVNAGSLTAAARQTGSGIEFVAKSQTDATAPLENLGAVSVTGNAAVPIEVTASLHADARANGEVTAGLQTSSVASVENVALSAAHSSGAVENVSGVQSDGVVQDEVSTSVLVSSGAAVPIEVTSGFVASAAAVFEAFRAFVAKLNPNYIAKGKPRHLTSLGDKRSFVAIGKKRRFVVVGINNRMSQTNDLFPPIDDTVEVETVTFDYGVILKSGVTITGTPEIEISIVSGTDPSPDTRLVGSPQVVSSPNSKGASQAVSQLVGNMIAGVTYLIQCVVTSSDGQTISLWTRLACVKPGQL